MKSWFLRVEQRNMPHFARGCAFGLGFWIFGMKIWSAGFSPVLFSFLAVFIFSACWEIRDQIRWQRENKGDGADVMDVVCDLFGWLFGQLYHLATHRYDEG